MVRPVGTVMIAPVMQTIGLNATCWECRWSSGLVPESKADELLEDAEAHAAIHLGKPEDGSGRDGNLNVGVDGGGQILEAKQALSRVSADGINEGKNE